MFDPGSMSAAVAGGVGSFTGDLVGAYVQDRWNRKAAADDRAFAERMSSTAWQRGVSDMRKAGINPLLAASKGGASSPATSTRTGGSAASGTAAMATALQMKRLKSEIALLDAQASDVNESARQKREWGDSDWGRVIGSIMKMLGIDEKEARTYLRRMLGLDEPPGPKDGRSAGGRPPPITKQSSPGRSSSRPQDRSAGGRPPHMSRGR